MVVASQKYALPSILNVLKIPILGEAYVGKTTIANVLSGGGYISDYKMTIGVDIFIRYLDTTSGTLKVQLWDLAGQKRFSFLRKIFYKGSHGAIFVFDLTRPKTIEVLEDWIKDFKYLYPDTPIILVGNKKDLVNDRKIPETYGDSLAKKFNTEYIEISAKTGENVEKSFNILLTKIAKRFAVLSL